MKNKYVFLAKPSPRIFLRECWVTLAFSLIVLLPITTHADAVDDYVHKEMASKKIPGLSLAVILDGKVVKETAYGLASIELSVPVTLDTSYPLASMTKIFTAVAILQLVEQGRISLDEPVSKILPQLPKKWSAVSIRECLAHTTGLPSAVLDDINTTAINGDRVNLLNDLGKKDNEPAGEKTSYNGTDYLLLAMVIEKISAVNYEQYVKDNVLKPAGLVGMQFGDAWAIIPGRSDLYTALEPTSDHTKLLVRDGQPVRLADKISRFGSKSWPDWMNSAAGLNGSIRDLVSWEAVLAGGKILKASSLAEMTKPFKLRNGKDGDFGLGFLIYPVGPKKEKAVTYGGGAATWRLQIPADHLTVIVLTNLQDSEPHALTRDIAALYVPELAKHPTQ